MTISYQEIEAAEAELARVVKARDAIVAKGQAAPEIDEAIAAMTQAIGEAEADLIADRLVKLRDLPGDALAALSHALQQPSLGRRGRDEVLKVAERVAALYRVNARIKVALDAGMISAAGTA